MQHLSGILARLVHQSLSNRQKPWESCFNDLIEVGSILPGFEAVDATNGKKALQARKYGGDVVRIEKLSSDVYKAWPFLGEIVVQNLLQYWDELLPNLRWGGSEDREEPFSKSALLIFRYGFVLCILARGPSSGNAVLEVHNGCGRGQYSSGGGVATWGLCVLDRRTEASCSACKISRSASVKPGWSSAWKVQLAHGPDSIAQKGLRSSSRVLPCVSHRRRHPVSQRFDLAI